MNRRVSVRGRFGKFERPHHADSALHALNHCDARLSTPCTHHGRAAKCKRLFLNRFGASSGVAICRAFDTATNLWAREGAFWLEASRCVYTAIEILCVPDQSAVKDPNADGPTSVKTLWIFCAFVSASFSLAATTEAAAHGKLREQTQRLRRPQGCFIPSEQKKRLRSCTRPKALL